MNKLECKIDSYGNKRWYLNSKCHRTDGPAIEWANGSKEWWLNGKYYCSTNQLNFYFITGLIKWLNDRKRYE